MFSNVFLRDSDRNSENVGLIWLSVSDGQNTCSSKGVSFRPTLNKSWFAVLLPTHQSWPYPKIFVIFFLNPGYISMTDTAFSSLKTVF